MKKHDELLLQDFLTTFYGYGNFDSDYWFIGMEEGGGNELDEVKKRLNTWHELGGTELVDIFDFHNMINFLEYFTDPVKLQKTWMQQARIVLASKGMASSTADVKIYQRDIIGRKKSETCLLEILPLPSPNISKWHYGNWTDISYLRTREKYRDYCLPWRIKTIRSKVQNHQPSYVIFCSKSYFKYWQIIAGNDLIFQKRNGFFSAKSGGILYLIINHPAAWGTTNAYFESIGEFIKTNQNG